MDVDEEQPAVDEPEIGDSDNISNKNNNSNNNNSETANANNTSEEEAANLRLTSVQEQRMQIKKIGFKPQVVGETWYPLSKKWHESWKSFTMFKKANSDIPGGIETMHLNEDLVRPERIDNSDLQDPNNDRALKKDIQENLTHIWVHESEWNLFYSWYGGGPAFPRHVYERGGYNKQKYICIYPKLVKTVLCNQETGELDQSTENVKGFPPSYTLKSLATDMEDEFFAAEKKKSDENIPYVHIWAKFDKVKNIYPIKARKVQISIEDLKDEDGERWVEVPDDYLKTKLDDIDFTDDTQILVEKRNEDGTWPRAKSEDNWRNIEVGDILDVLDENKKWYECVIRFVYKPTAAVTAGEDASANADAAATTGTDTDAAAATTEETVADGRADEEAAAAANASADAPAAEDGRAAEAAGGAEAVVDEQTRTQLAVHYIGWNTKWDEKVFADDETRVRRRHTETSGPHRPKKKEYMYSSGGGGGGSYGAYSGGGYYDRSTTFSFYQNDRGKSEEKGVVGLRNLGNTCFMNSTIQCLAQSPWLTDYFLDNEYIHHINTKNPLGWGGRVATAWGSLLHDMFSEKYRVIAPRQFKDAIGEVAPRFLGYAQQDSQELLSFLLDGLHEDLNQIENKPSTQSVESAGREDAVVAAESWKTYLRRNQSIVVDMMQGQYRSEVVCPDCKRISVTFDPYLFLSVPLPTERHKMIEYTFIASDTAQSPKIYGQKMLKVADIDMLKQSISSSHSIPKEEIFVCDIWKSKIHRELRKHDAVGDINRISDDIFVYHSPRPEVDPKIVVDFDEKQRIKDEEEAERRSNNNYSSTDYRTYNYGGDDGGVAGAGYRYHYSYQKQKRGPRKVPDYQTFVVIHQHRVPVKHIYYANQSRFEDEAIGFPLLMTLSMKKPITVNEIRQRLWQMMVPFMENKNMQLDDEAVPFRFWAAWGYQDHCKLEPSDDVFDLQRRNLKFLIHWSDVGQFESQLVERNQRQRDESAPSATANRQEDDRARYARAKPIDLQHCFDAFCEKEVLSENDAWFCSKCQGFKCASKKIDLWNSPDLLIIHLKRFSYTRSWRDRINTLVKFPLEGLDLSTYLMDANAKGDAIYDCYAVSNHMGGMGGGHYTAYARSLENQTWFQLDDSRAMRVANTERIVSSAAYVLYYRKRQPRRLKHRASKIFIDEIPAAVPEVEDEPADDADGNTDGNADETSANADADNGSGGGGGKRAQNTDENVSSASAPAAGDANEDIVPAQAGAD